MKTCYTGLFVHDVSYQKIWICTFFKFNKNKGYQNISVKIETAYAWANIFPSTKNPQGLLVQKAWSSNFISSDKWPVECIQYRSIICDMHIQRDLSTIKRQIEDAKGWWWKSLSLYTTFVYSFVSSLKKKQFFIIVWYRRQMSSMENQKSNVLYFSNALF